ncbi:MAG: terminase small subunit [Cyanobacteria bacterium P01_H01_bin.150]
MPKKTTDKYGLTEKELRFCQEYLIDFNATAAAKRAGFQSKTYENLRIIGSRLVTKANIANALSHFKAIRSRRTGVAQDRVLQELARIAFACITDVTQIKHGEMVLNMEEPSKDDFLAHMEWQDRLAAVAEIDERIITDSEGNQKSTYKIKLHDKLKALSLLMKHLGMLNDFDMSIACLREKYGLSLTRDDSGNWEVIDLSKVAAE